MLYTIYKVTNKINGKVYVGKHQTESLEKYDPYFAGGTYVGNAIRKHGKENFTREITHIFETEKEMDDKEREIVNPEFVARDDTYNLVVGGQGGCIVLYHEHPKYEETIKKISAANRGNVTSRRREQLDRLHKSNVGLKRTAETREKMSSAARGRTKSPEAVAKQRESRHKTMSDPTYVHPGLGRELSENHRKNISKGHADISGSKNPMFGKKHSPETIEKIRAKALNRRRA